MTPFQTILCAVDQSEYSRSTLQRALDLGRVFRATVAVMTVVREGDEKYKRSPDLDAGVDLDQALGLWHAGAEERAVARLLAFAQEATGATPARAIAVRGPVVPTILRVAKDLAAELLVVGMHGPPSGFTHLILSPVTERVIVKATCPVLAVPRRPPASPADFSVRTIVCGIDRSPSSRRALEHACVLARRLDARLIVVHAIEDLEDEDPSVTTGLRNTPECRRNAAPAVRAWYEQAILAGVRRIQDVDLQTPVGAAHEELLRTAHEAGAGLIVIGTTGWRGSAGKTVRRVVRDAGCDVMTVPVGPAI